MTDEELVQLYQNGDKQALNELIVQCMKFVKWVVNSYVFNDIQAIDFDDLLQEGCMGLVRAADKYDFQNKNKATFLTYAAYHVKARISEYIRKHNTHNVDSLNSPTYDDNGAELIDTLKDNNDIYASINEKIDKNILKQDLENLMIDNLSLQQRTILKFLYGWEGKCLTYDEIAQILNISNQTVYIKEKISLGVLRKTKWIHEDGALYYYGCKLEELHHADTNFNSFIVEDKLKKEYKNWINNDAWGDVFG